MLWKFLIGTCTKTYILLITTDKNIDAQNSLNRLMEHHEIRKILMCWARVKLCVSRNFGVEYDVS